MQVTTWWGLPTHWGMSAMELKSWWSWLLYSIKEVEIGGNCVLVCAEVPDVCRSMHLSFY